MSEAQIDFRDNGLRSATATSDFAELVQLAWANRISLSATGYYRTPKINYDRATFSGRPFYYFAYGAAVTEVVVDTLTGENRVLRADILHDCGDSLNPAIDLGQVEGGYVQGVGWLTTEELCWNDKGDLRTHAPSTYKIPTCSDLAPDFRVELVQNLANREKTIYRSKAVGEPPLMLGLSAFHRDSRRDRGRDRPMPDLQAPATPEAILRALRGAVAMNEWIDELSDLSAAGEPAVLVTVAGIRGSAPREIGAKMIVTATRDDRHDRWRAARVPEYARCGWHAGRRTTCAAEFPAGFVDGAVLRRCRRDSVRAGCRRYARLAARSARAARPARTGGRRDAHFALGAEQVRGDGGPGIRCRRTGCGARHGCAQRVQFSRQAGARSAMCRSSTSPWWFRI